MKKLIFKNENNETIYEINYEELVEGFGYENDKVIHKLIFKSIYMQTKNIPEFYSNIQSTYFEFDNNKYKVSAGNINIFKQIDNMNLEIVLERN